MPSTWCSSTFLKFFKFYQIKEGNAISWGEPIQQNSKIIWSPLLYFNIWTLKDPNALSFIRFQCILYDSGVPFPAFWKFIKLKMGDLISWGEPILQNGWIIWSPFLHFNLSSLKDLNCLPFVRFQCVLHEALVLFSGFSNFLKLKRGDAISWGQPIQQNS